MWRFVVMAKRVKSNRSPIDADYYYNCKYSLGSTCAHIHTPIRKFSPLFLIHTHTLSIYCSPLILFYKISTLLFFSYCYHPEEHVFHSDSVSVFSLLYLCLLLPVVVMFIFTICYVSRNSRTLFSVCLILFKYFVHFFCFAIVNAVAYNFFYCLHPQCPLHVIEYALLRVCNLIACICTLSAELCCQTFFCCCGHSTFLCIFPAKRTQ